MSLSVKKEVLLKDVAKQKNQYVDKLRTYRMELKTQKARMKKALNQYDKIRTELVVFKKFGTDLREKMKQIRNRKY